MDRYTQRTAFDGPVREETPIERTQITPLTMLSLSMQATMSSMYYLRQNCHYHYMCLCCR